MRYVLVSQRLDENTTYIEDRCALDIRWGALFESLSLIPLPVLPDFSIDKYFVNNNIAGILLTGGNDLSLVSDRPIDKLRDEIDEGLLKFGMQMSIPILGVCRGAQFLGTYFGNELVRVKEHVGVNHQLILTENPSSNFEFYTKAIVNSFHSFGFYSVKPPLSPIALGSDKSIEAFQHDSKPIRGIMWHPERCSPFMDYDLAMISSFFGLEQ